MCGVCLVTLHPSCHALRILPGPHAVVVVSRPESQDTHAEGCAGVIAEHFVRFLLVGGCLLRPVVTSDIRFEELKLDLWITFVQITIITAIELLSRYLSYPVKGDI